MILDKKQIDIGKFKSVFAKKFKNFCSKLPILISYEFLPNGIIIYEHFDEENEDNKKQIIYYEYDYPISVQKNIYNIKRQLYDYLPILTQIIKVEVEAGAQEVNTKVASGEISFNDVTPTGYMIFQERNWQIEKVIIDRDEIFIRDLDTKILYRYKLKYPVFTFLKKLRNEEFTQKEGWEFFIRKAKQLPLDPGDEGEKKESSYDKD